MSYYVHNQGGQLSSYNNEGQEVFDRLYQDAEELQHRRRSKQEDAAYEKDRKEAEHLTPGRNPNILAKSKELALKRDSWKELTANPDGSASTMRKEKLRRELDNKEMKDVTFAPKISEISSEICKEHARGTPKAKVEDRLLQKHSECKDRMASHLSSLSPSAAALSRTEEEALVKRLYVVPTPAWAEDHSRRERGGSQTLVASLGNGTAVTTALSPKEAAVVGDRLHSTPLKGKQPSYLREINAASADDILRQEGGGRDENEGRGSPYIGPYSRILAAVHNMKRDQSAKEENKKGLSVSEETRRLFGSDQKRMTPKQSDDFYNKQMEWKRQHQERREKEHMKKMQQAQEEIRKNEEANLMAAKKRNGSASSSVPNVVDRLMSNSKRQQQKGLSSSIPTLPSPSSETNRLSTLLVIDDELEFVDTAEKLRALALQQGKVDWDALFEDAILR